MEISKKAKLPTRFGDFFVQSFKDEHKEHLVVFTEVLSEEILLRVHSECMSGDVFASLKCDCRAELEYSLNLIAKNNGMLIYLRQEGRGIGLFNKINAYALQDSGLDTIEANLALGLPEDARDYEIVGEILAYFGIKAVRLLTNNPLKIGEIEKFVKVKREEIIVGQNQHNKDYLHIKKHKMGHFL